MTPRAQRSALLKTALFALLGVYFCYVGIRSAGFVRVLFILIGVVDFAIAYNYLRRIIGR